MDDSIPVPTPLTDTNVSPSPEDFIPAIIPLTIDDPAPAPQNLQYLVIIDSGSSGSRISIYSPYEGSADEQTNSNRRLGVKLIFGPIETSGGIHNADTLAKMERHLKPILRPANQVLTILGANRENSAIYLLATGGMRSLDSAVYNRVLANARTVIERFPKRLFAYRQAYIRAITGQQEGWLAWIFQNYDRFGPSVRIRGGSLEMGGASVQYTYAVRDVHSPILCTNSNAANLDKKHVYSQTWEGLGSNSLNDELIRVKCLTAPCDNPCLPKGMLTKTKNGVETRGTGNFAACYNFAETTHTARGLPNLASLPETDILRAISTFYYTYRYFEPKRGKYNPTRFAAKVKKYCEGDWNRDNSDKFAATRCLNAAWMLVSFKNLERGKQIHFSAAVDWPHAAAALIKYNGGLKSCPGESEWEAFVPLALNGNSNVSFVDIPGIPSLPAPAQLHAAPVTTPLITLWAYLPFAVALMFITRLLVQRSRAKAHSKIHLPDLEESVDGKGDMQDLAGTILGSEGFYKD